MLIKLIFCDIELVGKILNLQFSGLVLLLELPKIGSIDELLCSFMTGI
jgi:hypothetical protein